MHDPLLKPTLLTPQKITSLVILIAIGIGLVLVWPIIQKRFGPTDLSKYLPANSIVFINLKESSFNPAATKEAFNFPALQTSLSRWFAISPELVETIWDSINDQAALAWIRQNNDIAPIIILSTKNHQLAAAAQSENLNAITLDKNILALSPNASVLKPLMQITPEASLANAIPNRYLNPFVLIYINTDQPLAGQPFESISFINYLANLYEVKSLTFYLNRGDNRFEYTAFMQSGKSDLDFISAAPLALFEQLPNNIFVALNDINLASLFQNLGRQNPAIAKAYEQIINRWQQKYAFNFSADVIPLINQKSDLIMAKPHTTSSLAFVYKTKLSKSQEQNLNAIIRHIIAREFPEVKSRVLPDGTEVDELIFNPDRFSFTANTLNGVTLYSLPVPEANLTINHARVNNETLISNSQELLKQQIYAPPNENLYCPSEQSSFLVFLPAPKLLNYFDAKTISIYFDQGPFITGCFHKN
ncbi:MAG: hypothetical protein COT81_04960 [Candidatus Buchananbacteria bacterium CG10_big_fil_rev_8_21_14_0_10_42_9]|uniref:DUF3352 domain-containing protein n=1 Tax=Candidatus Buchananbacteria bacterium CG10_big_fil_rev_8_21_14_0_10_42_9 TaxID=1974526 RepID=A0A2H0W060_9BACT|nr:MAG: hypothetical protein COT81_04960 [Candidatus Buchananbacteria bacterium CG10_big_fil_rev_8_21_14_0_10_42_9]